MVHSCWEFAARAVILHAGILSVLVLPARIPSYRFQSWNPPSTSPGCNIMLVLLLWLYYRSSSSHLPHAILSLTFLIAIYRPFSIIYHLSGLYSKLRVILASLCLDLPHTRNFVRKTDLPLTLWFHFVNIGLVDFQLNVFQASGVRITRSLEYWIFWSIWPENLSG